MWESYKAQVEHEFRFHPNKEEILQKMEADEFSIQDIDRWYDEAAYYNGLHWEKRFKQLAEQAEKNGVKTVSFKVVRGNGKDSQHVETAGEDRSSNEH